MEAPGITRRDVLRTGAVGVAGLSVLRVTAPASALQGSAAVPRVVVPWQDQPEPVPPPAREVVGRQLQWERLASRVTPNEQFFTVKHYDQPRLSPTTWRLSLSGLVGRPLIMTLGWLRSQPRQTVEYTMECSGNHGLPFFTGGIGNARWSGTSLQRLLRAARPLEGATEVVFWGADRGPVVLGDNSGITSAGRTGELVPDAGGGQDLRITEQFARSTTLEEALSPDNLLAYEMNGVALPPEHGFPLRLIAPGWYGVANVKWLTRIEVTSGRFAGRFMARDYVTVREQQRDGETVWTFTTVGKDRLKSAPARVVRAGDRWTVHGAAWGAPVGAVEVQVDGGPWQRVRLAPRLPGPSGTSGHAWRLWAYEWGTPRPGLHTVRSRAFDTRGVVQPPPDDPFLASRRTYWEDNGQITRQVLVP